MFKYAALTVAGVAIASIGPSLGQTKANYSVTLEASWTAEMHPLEYPSDAHFSGLVGATHNGDYTTFKDGGVASEGLRRLAERGSHSPLTDEIRDAIGKGAAGAVFEGRALFNMPAQDTVSFEASDKFPMVPIAAMIAPSPDWFTGATINLMKDGTWVDGATVTLYAWDAGTDSGKTYGAADEETLPRQPIMMNAAPHFMRDGKPTPVAKLTVKKMN